MLVQWADEDWNICKLYTNNTQLNAISESDTFLGLAQRVVDFFMRKQET